MSILTTNAGVVVGNKPSVLDLVKLQGAWDTPLFSSFKSGPASQINHSWITDSLRATADNAQMEGAGTTNYASGSKVLHTNTMQIFTTDVKVSFSQEATATYGAKTLQHELMKGAKEHALDIEYGLLGLGNTTVFTDKVTRIANTTAGRMGSIFNYIPEANRINFSTATAGSEVADTATSLTYALFQSILEPIWQEGGSASAVYVGPTLKKVINTFDIGSSVQRTINDSANYDPRITKVSTDFGIVDVKLHRMFVASYDTKINELTSGDAVNMDSVILAGDFSTCTVRNLIPTKLDAVSSSDTAMVKRYYTECTLEVLNPDLISCGFNFTA